MGTLHIVATPIGHLEDVTLRALRVLREADWVLAEDTRRTRVLLDHFEIPQKPTPADDEVDLDPRRTDVAIDDAIPSRLEVSSGARLAFASESLST